MNITKIKLSILQRIKNKLIMGFNFDIVNGQHDINKELKNAGLSYAYLTWKNILSTYSDILLIRFMKNYMKQAP